MKKFISILGASFIWIALIAPANSGPVGIGVTLQTGKYGTSGTETEKTVTSVTSEQTSKTVEEAFMGASVYAEFRTDNGWALGVDYVPMNIDLGSGKRTDASTGADSTAEADTGDRSASAEIDGLTTIYAHIPIGPLYVLLGYHSADVTTTETLPTSSYPNASINGFQYGIGMKSDNQRVRAEIAYSDFDNITLTSSANTNKITASADAVSFKLSIGF